MGDSKKKTPAEELIDSMLKDMGDIDLSDLTNSSDNVIDQDDSSTHSNIEGLIFNTEDGGEPGFILSVDNADYEADFKTEFELTRKSDGKLLEGLDGELTGTFNLSIDDSGQGLLSAMSEEKNQNKEIKLEEIKLEEKKPEEIKIIPLEIEPEPTRASSSKTPETPEIPKFEEAFQAPKIPEIQTEYSEIKTEVLKPTESEKTNQFANQTIMPENKVVNTSTNQDLDKTVAVAGYQVRPDSDFEDKVKISVGQNRTTTGYQIWGSGGSTESNLAQAGNLQMAQEKIVDLEKENEKLRRQNEELMAASEIIKERADLLSAQIVEYKNDREGLEDSFQNEIVLLKNHLSKKDGELRRAQFKTEELDSRLKFDMKKIRIRERELENRLELIRAEKNAIVRNKDEQILDLRRKMDVLQMEVESYRQKCVELNKVIESSQESFKRTTRALRLAMANLELQEENKTPLKKVD